MSIYLSVADLNRQPYGGPDGIEYHFSQAELETLIKKVADYAVTNCISQKADRMITAHSRPFWEARW